MNIELFGSNFKATEITIFAYSVLCYFTKEAEVFFIVGLKVV